jgi:hypothetical protein
VPLAETGPPRQGADPPVRPQHPGGAPQDEGGRLDDARPHAAVHPNPVSMGYTAPAAMVGITSPWGVPCALGRPLCRPSASPWVGVFCRSSCSFQSGSASRQVGDSLQSLEVHRVQAGGGGTAPPAVMAALRKWPGARAASMPRAWGSIKVVGKKGVRAVPLHQISR